jgi:Zn-dependent protease
MKKFEKNETIDILVSILALSLFFTFPEWSERYFLYLGIISFSFLLKQAVHKMMARKFQCTSTYRMRPLFILIGLFFMLFKPVFGISFMAAGTIDIVPYSFGRKGLKLVKLTPYDLGMIALAGIAVNLFLAYTFLFVENEIATLIVKINSLIAIFNLLPFPGFDGSKVYIWTIWGWFFIFLLSILPLILV